MKFDRWCAWRFWCLFLPIKSFANHRTSLTPSHLTSQVYLSTLDWELDMANWHTVFQWRLWGNMRRNCSEYFWFFLIFSPLPALTRRLHFASECALSPGVLGASSAESCRWRLAAKAFDCNLFKQVYADELFLHAPHLSAAFSIYLLFSPSISFQLIVIYVQVFD